MLRHGDAGAAAAVGGSWISLEISTLPHEYRRFEALTKYKIQTSGPGGSSISELFTLTLETELHCGDRNASRRAPTSKALRADLPLHDIPNGYRATHCAPSSPTQGRPLTSSGAGFSGMAHYFRSKSRFILTRSPLPILEVPPVAAHVPGALVTGKSEVLRNDGTMFFGFEHPLSVSTVENGQAVAMLQRKLHCDGGRPSLIFGRRFRCERTDAPHVFQISGAGACPSLPAFLHYNTWYDLGYQDRYNSAGALTGSTRLARSWLRSVGKARFLPV